MKKSMLPSITFLASALALGVAGDSVFARGGHSGGSHFHGTVGSGNAGGFSAGAAPSILSTPMSTTPQGLAAEGLNFNNQMLNGTTGTDLLQPQTGTMNGQLGEGTELGTTSPSIETQLGTTNNPSSIETQLGTTDNPSSIESQLGTIESELGTIESQIEMNGQPGTFTPP